MPIRRLLLENYRAFHERQQIELAAPRHFRDLCQSYQIQALTPIDA